MNIIKKQYSSRFTGEGRPGRTEQDHVSRYAFAAMHAQGKNVLDIACGTGYGSLMLKEAGAVSVTGVDVSPDAITFATRNHALDGISYVCANAEATSDLGPFDLIVSFETIEHVHDYRKTLSNLHTMLKPGGTLIMSTPNRPVTSPNTKSIHDKPANDYHVREWDLSEFISTIRGAGFDLPDSGLHGQCLPKKIGSRVIRKLNRLYGWFEDPKYRAEVRPVAELPSLRFITIVATKPV